MRRLSILLFAAGGLVALLAAPATLHPGAWLVVGILAIVAAVRPGSTTAFLLAPVVVGLSALAPLGSAVTVVGLVLLGTAWTFADGRITRLASAGPALAVVAAVLVSLAIGDRRIDNEPDGSSGAPTAVDDVDDQERIELLVDLADDAAYDWPVGPLLTDGPYHFDIAVEGSPIAFADDGAFEYPIGSTSSTRFAVPPWWLFVLAFAAAWFSLHIVWRARSISLGTGADERSGPDPVDWYDELVSRAGHPRPSNEPILAHGRRVAAETGDGRYARLAGLVSENVYAGRSLADDALCLFDEPAP